MTFRDPLAAALARAEAAEAALARRPVEPTVPAPTRWRVAWSEGGDVLAEGTLAIVVAADLAWCTAFVLLGASSPYVARGSLVCAVVTIAWALAFVRRVPVDGGAP